MKGTTAFIGLGANLGEPRRALAWALDRLATHPQVRVVAVSSLYRSAPIDAGGPDFLNAVAQLQTTLDAPGLLHALHALEAEAGRQRPYLNAPRVLDLDLLSFGRELSHAAALTLPHPRLHLRRFVLEPLHEIAPGLTLPGLPPLGELRAAVQAQRVDREADGRSWWPCVRHAPAGRP